MEVETSGSNDGLSATTGLAESADAAGGCRGSRKSGRWWKDPRKEKLV